MRQLTATTRVTIGLVCLSVSVWLMAVTLGIVPDIRRATAEGRSALCESVAIHCSLLASQGDLKTIESAIKALVKRNKDVVFIQVRQADGTCLIHEGQGKVVLPTGDKPRQTASRVDVPILAGSEVWGSVVVEFSDAKRSGMLAWLGHPVFLLLTFLGSASYLVYFVYLRKMLQHLDPSKVIPDRVRATLDTLAEGLLVVDENDRIVLANRTFANTMDVDPDGLLGRKASHLPWIKQRDQSFPWIDAIRKGETQTGQMLVMRDRGSRQRTFRVNASPIFGPSGKSRGAFASFDDVTVVEQSRAEMQEMLQSLSQSRDEIRRQNEELERLATQDPLTACLNRRSFFQQFETHWKHARRHGHPLSCVLLDIDYFKSINDEHGHSVGDLVLQKIANTLRATVRDGDLVGRYGGEEFCILLPDLDVDEAVQAAQRYRQALASQKIGNLEVTASFGVSSMSLGAGTPQKLLDESDKSLYFAKRNGRNRVARWDEVPDDLVIDQAKVSRIKPHKSSGSVVGLSAKSLEAADELDVAIPFHAVTALTSALAFRDEDTAEHSRRVADLCVATAMDLMSVADTYVLEVAALLHDIGKIGVPDAILLKPGPLTAEEWKVMGVHDRIGVEIVSSTFASDALLAIIQNHHAFFGGKGRDRSLPTGDDIPLGARILSIADAYDAMVSNRVYRQGMNQDEALAELRRCAPAQFDPQLVKRFVDVVRARDQNRSKEVAPVSKQTALRIGEQIERLAVALDNEDIPGLAALAGRLHATATKQGVTEIASVAGNLQEAASEMDSSETIRLTNELLELCRSTQKAYLDSIEQQRLEFADSANR